MNRYAVLDWLAMESARILRNYDLARRPLTVRVADFTGECTIRTDQGLAGHLCEPISRQDADDLVTLGLCYSFEAVTAWLQKHLANYWPSDADDAFRTACFGSALASSPSIVDTERIS